MVGNKRLTESRLLNRQRFFNGAAPLFERLGYIKTTIQDICQATGLSKPTFYDLFKDKSDLFAQMLISIYENELNRWKSELPDGADPLKQLLSFIGLYEDILAKKPIFRYILEDPIAMEKFAWIIYSTPHSPVLTLLRQILSDGVKTGQFRRLDPDSAVWMIYAVLDSMYVMLPMLIDKPGAGEDPALAEEVKQFILNGIGVVLNEK